MRFFMRMCDAYADFLPPGASRAFRMESNRPMLTVGCEEERTVVAWSAYAGAHRRNGSVFIP